ncbi:MAG: M28 family peptidase [Candidatus Krumholzibacteria bacterium]|nr:M28 family peptidase [Candidatus Krumholzibacteria bacterium]
MQQRNSSSSTSRRIAAALPLLTAVILAALTGCGSGDVPEFDSASAFTFLEQQVDIGFRYPGSPEHKQLQKYLTGRLQEFGANVSLQPFEAVLTTGDTLNLINIIGNYNRKASKRIMLAAHYDTRPFADRDPDPTNRDKPIAGANDGASGVAVLLEIARLLGESEPSVGVDIVLFDGEDYGREGTAIDYCLGSAHFARRLRGYKPYAAIVIDMIGDSDLEIMMEGYSRAASPVLLGELFDIAEQLGYGQFRRKKMEAIIDDHLPLIQAGINAVDLIDFDYDYWHTLEDTPDKCSPESLEAVGNVLLHYIWRQ